MLRNLTILLSLMFFSANCFAEEQLKRIKLLEVISEPEDGLKRQVYLYTNNESEIKRLDVEIDGKVNVSAEAHEMQTAKFHG